MCGISGFYSKNPIYKDLIKGSIDTIAYRGPDNLSVKHINTFVSFAHARLSIVDLHERSNQPFIDELTGNTIILNGEIFNYAELRNKLKNRIFKTTSDTEVLLYLLSDFDHDKALQLCNGFFAFAFWDNVNKKLILGRDRLGKKPLFYAIKDNSLFFASEAKALFAYNITPQPDHASILNYLFEITIGSNTSSFFKGIQQIENASLYCISFDGSGNLQVNKKVYWNPPAVNFDITYNEAVQRVKDLLIDSIQIRLSEEVKFAVMLSGGLDSSAITSIASKFNPEKKITAISAIYPGDTQDESHYARSVTEMYTNLDTIWVDDITFENSDNYIDKVIRHHEIPLADGSIIAQYILMEKISQQGIKVILSGNGGDEVLAGYPGIFGPCQVASEIKHFNFSNFNPRAFYHTLPNFFKNSIYIQKHKNRGILVDDKYLGLIHPRFQKRFFHKDLLNEYLIHSLFHWTTPNLVWYEDRSSMGNSIESRSPFLDFRLVELLLSVPGNFKIDKNYSKRILRDALIGILPEPIRVRKDKQGFHAPVSKWIQFIDDSFLKDSHFRECFNYLDFNKVEKNNFIYYWRIYTLHKWFKIFF